MSINTHAWTHRPEALGGTDPIESFQFPWVRRIFTDTVGNITCQSGNDVVVTYNDAGVNANVWGGSDDWETYFDLFSSSQTQLLIAGHVIVSAKYRFIGNDELGMKTWLILNDGGNFPEVIGYLDSGSVGQLESPHVAGTFYEHYPATQTHLITLQQENPGDDVKTLDWGYTQWTYLGPYTGPDSNDADDPDPHE